MSNTKKVVNPIKDEVQETDTTFEYDGNSYVIPPAKKWPLDAVEAQEEGKMIGFIKALLGDDQYKTLRKNTNDLSQLDEFVGAMFESLGVDTGK